MSTSKLIEGSVTAADLSTEVSERYVVLGLLGEGGVGKVHHVFDRHLGREIALKGLKVTNRLAKQRFIEEARITGQLEHPGVVPVHELGLRESGEIYYAMKHVRGETLADALSDQPLEERLALLPRFIDVAQAMAYAHSRGVIHRDLKPDNIMLGEFGETVILDWGLAKLQRGPLTSPTPIPVPSELASEAMAGISSEGLTVEGQILGTPGFMAPEQTRGNSDEVDARADVYALGAILYCLLGGKPPFEGSSALAVLTKALTEDPPDLLKLEPRCPPELVAVAARALQRDPGERYPDAGALMRDVKAFVLGGLVGAHTYTPWTLTRRWLRRRWRLVLATTLALVVAAGTWWYRGYAEQARLEAEAKAAAEARLETVDEILDEARQGYSAGWFDTYALKLTSMKSPELEARLISALEDEAPLVRRLAARVLGGVGNRDAVPALIARLGEGVETDEEIIIEVIRALGIIGDPRAEGPVDAARDRHTQWSHVWLSTELAYKMIPQAPMTPEKAQDADAWVDRGVAFVEKGRNRDGLAAYRKAISLEPELWRAWNNLGLLYRRMGDYDAALNALDRALLLKTGDQHALINRSIVHRHRGDWEMALADANASVEIATSLRPSALRNRARIQWLLGRYDEAIADLEVARGLQPETRQTHAVYGQLWAARGDFGKAVSAYTLALGRDPTSALVYMARARVYRQRGELDKARADLSRAISWEPGWPDLLAERASLRLVEGDEDGAKADLDRSIQIKPTDGRRWAQRAVIFNVAIGELVAAQKDLATAVRRSSPADRVLHEMLKLAVDRRLGGRPPIPSPQGAVGWHDRLLKVIEGKGSLTALAEEVHTPTQRCELVLTARLRRQALPASLPSFTEAAPPSALACALLDAWGALP